MSRNRVEEWVGHLVRQPVGHRSPEIDWRPRGDLTTCGYRLRDDFRRTSRGVWHDYLPWLFVIDSRSQPLNLLHLEKPPPDMNACSL